MMAATSPVFTVRFSPSRMVLSSTRTVRFLISSIVKPSSSKASEGHDFIDETVKVPLGSAANIEEVRRCAGGRILGGAEAVFAQTTEPRPRLDQDQVVVLAKGAQ